MYMLMARHSNMKMTLGSFLGGVSKARRVPSQEGYGIVLQSESDLSQMP